MAVANNRSNCIAGRWYIDNSPFWYIFRLGGQGSTRMTRYASLPGDVGGHLTYEKDN